MGSSISIAMTSYNGEFYIKEQIDSILSQTVSFDELVICDDCSNDNTPQILKDYSSVDNRIKVFFNETNLGFKRNFEKAIKLCSSNFIALSDQDDIWIPEHLELLKKAYDENDCILTCGNSFAADAEGKPIGIKSKPDTYYLSDKSKEQFLQVLYSNPVQGCTAYFHKDLLNTFIPIPDSQFFHDSWLAQVAITKGKIVFLHEGLLYYRTHNNNVSGGTSKGFKAKLHHLFHEKDNDMLKHQIIYNSDLKRLPLSEVQNQILDESFIFLKRITRIFPRFLAIPYFLRNYKLIYTTTSYKYLLPRFFVKFILHK